MSRLKLHLRRLDHCRTPTSFRLTFITCRCARKFDYAFSVGVLHHLPDPRGGFLSLASKVKPGGHISAWIYGAENNEWITRWVNPVREKITSRIDRRALLAIVKSPGGLCVSARRS